MILLDPKELISYVPISERDKENPITFWFHPLTVSKYLKYTNLSRPIVDAAGNVEITGAAQLKVELFDNEIVKVENVIWPGNDEAETIEGKEAVAKLREFIQPPIIFIEIVRTIETSGTINEDTKKK